MSFRITTALMIAALLVTGLYASLPRKANLRDFDPGRMAARETAMWRDYYEKRYLGLLGNLYLSSRDAFGFSPLDSLRIAVAAAEAARLFQPTRSREEANAALPWLVSYYRVLRQAAPAGFDVERAAALELDWWQARREGVPPKVYGRTIAATSAMIYGRDEALIEEAGIARARAMAYRDAHGETMGEADWVKIEAMLVEAYGLLRRGVTARPE